MKNILYVLLTACMVNCNAQTHQLITTAEYGGQYGEGAIFSADSNGNNFHLVYSFQNATGRWPIGRLTMDTNGTFYGVTEFGGPSDSCTIYSYNPQTTTYTLLHDFGLTENLGWWDQTGPILLPDGNLYGQGEYGGQYGGGTIYSLNPATLQYQDLFDFDTVGTTGMVSQSGLFYTDGLLYGMNIGGGTYGKGALFSFDPATSAFTALHQFIDSTGAGIGAGALMKASDNKLYGVTQSGGPVMAGTIFSYDLATNTYSCIHKFNALYDGATPNNGLVQAADGKLYGLTSQAAIHSAGTLYSLDIQNDSLTTLYVFDKVHGGSPLSNLTLGSDGLLYGTTSAGGTYNGGVAFSYNIDSNIYTVLFNFDTAVVSNPSGTVLDYYPHQSSGTSPLSAGFSASALAVCAGTQVSFIDTSTGSPTSWSWTFAGGIPDTSTSRNPVVIYNQQGPYTVQLVVSKSGTKDTSIKPGYITVYALPNERIYAPDSGFCKGESMVLCAINSFVSYHWNNGDTSSCDTVFQAGSYAVTVTDTNGCSAGNDSVTISIFPAPPDSIIATGDTMYASDALTYQWYLNDSLLPYQTVNRLISGTPGTYSVVVTDNNGCSATSAGHVITGIDELEQSKALALYPNPTTDQLYIKTQGIKPETIIIYDVNGRMITSMAFQPELDVSKLSSGVYLIEVKSNMGVARKRFVKM